MINTIRQKLVEMNKNCCESASLYGEEKGKGVRLTPSPRGQAIKIKVDGCLITDTKRCDCLYFYEISGKRHAFLVELKGTHYADALVQLAATKAHLSYTTLLDAAKPCKESAVAIVAEKAKTNRPKKDEWEDDNNLRLNIIPLGDNKTFDISTLLRK